MLIKLLKIGCTNAIASFMPIVLWFSIGLLYKDESIQQGFSVTYSYQFLFMLFASILVRGQLKNEAKNSGTKAYSNLGIILFMLSGVIVFSLSILFSKNILEFFGFVHKTYLPVLVYGISMLLMDYTLYYLVLTIQYKADNRHAFKLSSLWYILRVIVILVVRIFVSDYRFGLCTVAGVQFIILLNVLFKELDIQHIGVDIKAGFKYTIADIPANVFMCLVYIIGYGNVSSTYFASYNLEALCTDTQWDILDSAIDTTVTKEICTNGMTNYKRLKVAGIVYSIILYLSSALMLFLCSFICKGVDIRITTIIFLVECSGFPFYALTYCVASRLAVQCPTVLSGILGVIRYIARLVVTTFVDSEYAISLGVVASCILCILQWFVIWLFTRKSIKVGVLNETCS